MSLREKSCAVVVSSCITTSLEGDSILLEADAASQLKAGSLLKLGTNVQSWINQEKKYMHRAQREREKKLEINPTSFNFEAEKKDSQSICFEFMFYKETQNVFQKSGKPNFNSQNA